jgi:hypothetical protein
VELEVLPRRAVGPDEVRVEVVVVPGLGHLFGDRGPSVLHPALQDQDPEALLRHVAGERQPVVPTADDDPVELPVDHRGSLRPAGHVSSQGKIYFGLKFEALVEQVVVATIEREEEAGLAAAKDAAVDGSFLKGSRWRSNGCRGWGSGRTDSRR